MLRVIFSYALSSLILVSQVGLPMHYHYCKGSLESISILFRKACDDEQATLAKVVPDCCKKFYRHHCKKGSNGCCHDQVKVISQDLTFLLPGIFYWAPAVVPSSFKFPQTPEIVSTTTSPFSCYSHETDSGPPIYIRFHSLIYYA
jgi:hypothetical protein